ncbi:hypothetical protein [Aeromonas enteropelogenes]|uniref:hypothetical protein n=1 Tax=Aeromonas enteropelogenes TaxID=29489 RepID=UPI002286C3E2|nr:hypothetical protein [Aeromonas enteropelogenes]MCZ0752584.1 hypothetical protein [Aeromonas enteropelogenes]
MRLPSIESKVILLGGGLDLATTPLAKAPGFAITAINVEPGVTGGYRRTLGFDRFDGRPRPSKTKGYFVFRTDGAVALPAEAFFQVVTWAGGSGVLLHVSGGDAFIGTDSSPSLAVGAAFSIGATSYTLANAPSRSARTIDDMLTASAKAADWRRTAIGQVPGIGPVRCVVAIRDEVFAIRDKSLEIGGLFRATSSGWQEITSFGSQVTVQDGFGIDDGDLDLIRHSDGATFNCAAQMAGDGYSGTLALPSGQSLAVGQVLRSAPVNNYAVTLSAALVGATTPTAETATNMLGGGTIDEKDNAGWYALVGSSFFPVVSYKKKDDTSSTVHVLTVWNVHGRVVPTSTAITIYRFTAFCEVVVSKAIALKAGGRYETLVHNFFGDPAMRRAYLASGVQRAIELRENGRIVPLITNQDDEVADTPIKIEAHASHLFVAYPGGQYAHSGPGNPLTWSGLLGANVFAVGDEITGLRTSAGGVLMVTAKNRTLALYGAGSKDWQQKVISESVGVQDGSLQPTFVPVGLSDRGLVRLDRVQEFGDFTLNLLDPGEKIQPIIERFRWHASTQVAAANQYRLFSPSGRNLAIKINADGGIEATEFSYGSPVDQAWRYDELEERNFFTLSGKDGWVFELDEEATSFDGGQIVWLLRLAYSHFGSPMVVKSFRSMTLEQSQRARLRARFSYSLDYRHGRQYKSDSIVLQQDGGQDGIWNYSNWNQFYWATESQDESSSLELQGSGTSLSMAFTGRSATEPNFYITGLTVNYIQRRLSRA